MFNYMILIIAYRKKTYRVIYQSKRFGLGKTWIVRKGLKLIGLHVTSFPLKLRNYIF